MESGFDRKRNLEERLRFVRWYAEWVKSVPNQEWSAQQAELVDSLFESGVGMPLTPEEYLRLVELRERRRQVKKAPRL